MSVPSPSIKPTLVAGGTHRCVYEGNVGVSGTLQNLNIDLTNIPYNIRLDQFFVQQLIVIAKSLGSGVVAVEPNTLVLSDFTFAVEQGKSTPQYLTVQVTSGAVDDQIMVIVEMPHTTTR